MAPYRKVIGLIPTSYTRLVVTKSKGSAARSVNREFVESCSTCNVWDAFLRVSSQNRGNHGILQYLSDQCRIIIYSVVHKRKRIEQINTTKLY